MKTPLRSLVLSLALAGPLHAVAPLISDVEDRVIARDTNTGALFFVVGDDRDRLHRPHGLRRF